MVFTVEKLRKQFQKKVVLDDVSFSVDEGEIVSLIGPSGVGKTTLLRILANLEHPDSGTIHFAQQPSRDNPVIMVFQDYLLFPNLTIYENTAFALRARRLAKTVIDRRVRDILAFFHLEDKADSYPVQLSAGQKQRVAIARAMVVNPAVLLLDEPFANLDRNLKLETATFIRDTQKAFGITTVSVTHDLEEAFAMSDKIGIMLEGKLVQFATPREIYHAPATLEAARFLGPVNELDSSVCHALGVPQKDGANILYVRPESLHIRKDSQGVGIIESVVFGGHYITYTIRVMDSLLTVYSLHNSLEVGDAVSVQVSL